MPKLHSYSHHSGKAIRRTGSLNTRTVRVSLSFLNSHPLLSLSSLSSANMATPNVNSTPFRASYAGRREYQQIIENAQEAQKQYGKQMRSNWAGPCDPLEFMQKRMPCAQSQMVDMPKDVKFELPVRTEPKLEKHIYQLFVCAAPSYVSHNTECYFHLYLTSFRTRRSKITTFPPTSCSLSAPTVERRAATLMVNGLCIGRMAE